MHVAEAISREHVQKTQWFGSGVASEVLDIGGDPDRGAGGDRRRVAVDHDIAASGHDEIDLGRIVVVTSGR